MYVLNEKKQEARDGTVCVLNEYEQEARDGSECS